MTTANLPVILLDEPVLQRCDAQGERVMRRQVIECDGRKFETLFWYHANGKLSRVTQTEL